MREIPALYAFNRGLCSPLGLARTDQKRIGLSAETMTNWIARVLGSMAIRPGLGYIGGILNNAAAKFLPFVFATTDTALVEFTDSNMRVWINDVVLTRTSVSTTVNNGTFAGNITGWTDSSESGGSIAWKAGNYLGITGTGTARGIASQALTISSADQTKEHGLRIVIARGDIFFQIGTSVGDDSIISNTNLDTGTYSLTFTPPSGIATVYLQFLNPDAYVTLVQQCTIEAAGVVSIPSPYVAADLSNIRYDQSGDTIFLACAGHQQRKIERRGTRPGARGWGLSLYRTLDGPFEVENHEPITVTASALTGDITLTASASLFSTGHVGALWKIVSQVSGVSASVAAQNTFTTGLKVTGSGTQRSITITLSGVSTWVAIVSLQVSSDNSSFSDVPGQTWNGNVTGPYLDGLDGQTRYYRIGVKTSNYTSGTVGCALTYTSGTLSGVVQITSYVNNKLVNAQVVSDLGDTSATALWSEGSWSSKRGFPTCVRLHEGRLWWAGQNGLNGSISDNYFSFDDNVIGDAGPIDRTIGSGPVDTINWIMSLQRMILGAQGAEFSVKSSAFDTPLTPTDFTIKAASTQGSAAIESLKIDQRGLYVDRTGTRVYEVVFDLQTYEYSSNDITAVVPELGLPGIVRIALQKKPDARMHCIRSDGTVMLSVLDKVEDVLAWQNVTTDGLVEDVAVLPGVNGSSEDQVYYVVNRTIGGSTVRYLEKWAKETECRGGTLNKQADAFIVYNGAPATVISGLSHLEGKAVVAWGDGADFSPGASGSQTTFTVSGGAITLPTPVQNAIVGLPYTAQWQSAKLGMQPSLAQTLLNQQKRISHIGVVAAWLHPLGIQFGPDFSHLDDMPGIERGVAVTAVRTEYDEQEFPFPGTWDTDARLCIVGQAPRPATLLAAVVDLEIHN